MWLSVIVVIVVALLWAGAGWYFSGQILALPTAGSTAADVTITAVGGTGPERTLMLTAPEGNDVLSPIVGGLDLAGGGFVRLGAVSSAPAPRTVVRLATLVRGSWPVAGSKVLGSKYGWSADPTVAIAPTAVPLTMHSDAGPLHETLLPGHGTTWVIGVHGRGARPREVFGILHDAHTVGLPGIAIEYRGAPGGPASDGRLHFGLTEWKDIQANVDYLRSRYGAKRFILVGFSLGGELVVQFLRNSPEAPEVTGLILDAPLIYLDATLRLRAAAMGIPGWILGPLIGTADAIASWRGGLDFGKLDAVGWLAAQRAPILLFHGSTDTSVAIGPSRDLAKRDARVEYHECVAGHVRCWNADPAAYDASVIGFLRHHQ